jgi:pentapeptide MXKDX repeat protein
VNAKDAQITVSGAPPQSRNIGDEARFIRAGSKNKKELSMRKLLLPLAASVVLLSSTAFAQTSDTKAPSTTGPAAQSGDNMSKGDMSKDKMSKTKVAKKKSKKSEEKTDKM